MKRRDFLKLSGLTSAALIAPASINGSLTALLPQEVGTTNQYVPKSSESQLFRALADPFGGIDLISPMGAIIGTIPLQVLNRYPITSDSLCCTGIVDSTSEAEAKRRLSTGKILSSTPKPFQTIYTYTLSAFSNSSEADLRSFNITGIVQPNDNFRRQAQNDRILGTISPNWDVKGQIGDYFVRLSLEKHFIGGCVKQDT